MELCGSINPVLDNWEYPCNLEKGHSGDHMNQQHVRTLSGDSPLKTFAQWPQAFPDYSGDDGDYDLRETLAKLTDGIMKLTPGRRERIATALAQGLLASGRYEHVADAVSVALGGADLLIQRLDR